MNILMVTNVYTPQIGGVTRSIQQYTAEYRRRGHNVLVIAPDYEENPENDEGVLRVPAIPNFYLNQYSLPIPVLALLLPEVRKLEPELVHSHHPFLLGTTAHTLASEFDVPLVYTHHTRYSTYIEAKTSWPHSVEEAVLELITGYCELTDVTIAPSEGIRRLLQERGIERRIEVVPTGVEFDRFQMGNGSQARQAYSIPQDAFVVGHCGRLAAEKNCRFLANALSRFLVDCPESRALIVGDGPERPVFEKTFAESGTSDRVTMTGFLEHEELVNAYAAMDVFAFASHSETQGMVLAEAMAAGACVVALAATGVDDIVQTGKNGIRLPKEDLQQFVDALKSIQNLSPQARTHYRQGAIETARSLSQSNCAERMLEVYSGLSGKNRQVRDSDWHELLHRWDGAWQRWKNRSRFVSTLARESVFPTPDDGEDEF